MYNLTPVMTRNLYTSRFTLTLEMIGMVKAAFGTWPARNANVSVFWGLPTVCVCVCQNVEGQGWGGGMKVWVVTYSAGN